MNEQLSLFNQEGAEYFRTVANSLLDILNLDLKPKEKYKIEYYYQHEKLFVLIASNREKNIVCNVVDENGNVPDGFCVCWRIHQHILQELNIESV